MSEREIAENDRMQNICYSPDDTVEEVRSQICARLLLYLQGLDVRAKERLEIAQESIRRAGSGADLAATLGEMHGLLREHGVDPHSLFADFAGDPGLGAPAMRRGVMLSEGVVVPSLHRWLRRPFAGALAPALRRREKLA